MSYTEVTVSGYNASPPPDDGTAVAANEVTWAGIKSKLADPIKTAFDTCQTNISSVVTSEIEVNDWAPVGTARIFYQAAAPTNWTKSTTNNDKAIRIVSGLTGGTAGGTTAFSSVLASRTILQGNLPNVSLSFSLTAASHSHTFSGTTGTESATHTHGVSGSTSTDGSHQHTGTTDSNGAHTHTYSKANGTTGGTTGSHQFFDGLDNGAGTSSDGAHTHTFTTGFAGSHSHTFSVTSGGQSVNHTHGYSGTTSSSAPAVSGTISLGGSGTAMDFAIQYMDCIVATKD